MFPRLHVAAVLLALSGSVALGQEVVPVDDVDRGVEPRGWARAEVRAQAGRHDDLDDWLADPQVSGVGRAHVELDRDIRLDIGHAHAGGGGGGRDLGYAELGVYDLRVGGGVVGDDGGVHVGWRPRLSTALTSWLRLDAGLDLAVGVGVLSGDDREVPPRADRRRFWRAGERAGIDIWSGSAAGDVALTFQPWRPIELVFGAHAVVFGAVAEPRGGDGLPGLDLGPARETDPGVLTTLSEGEVGGFAEARVRLLREVDDQAGRALELTLTYREAWDWIHRDLAYTTAAHGDPWDDVRLAPIPWRSTRTLELALSRAWSGGWLTASVDARLVDGSTTSEDFADRDGVSLGARLSGRVGRLYGAVGARHHLRGSKLERVLGKMPETAFTASLGVVAIDRRDLSVSVEGGFDLARQDDWGLPREGHAAYAALTVGFGGASTDTVLRGHALALPPPPRRLSPRVAGLSLNETGRGLGELTLDDLRGAAAGLDPVERKQYEGLLADAGVLDGDVTREDMQRVLDDPTLTAAAEALVPGITFAAEQLLGAQVAADPVAATLDDPSALLFTGYALDAADVGVTWGQGPTLSRAYTFGAAPAGPSASSIGQPSTPDDVRAAAARDARVAPRASGDASLLGGLDLHQGGILELARTRGWQKVAIARRRGDEHELVFQASTGWSRGMRLVLSGR